MNKLIPMTTALVLTLGLPQVATAQNNGNGNGKHEKGDRGYQDRQERHNEDRGERGDRDREDRSENREARRESRQQAREFRQEDREDRRADRNDERRDERRVEVRDGRVEVRDNDGQPVVVLRRDRERGLIAGCPPGLARKDNGCLPPGQARKLSAAGRFDSVWNRRNDDFTYRYDDGYLYRMNQQGSLLGYVPVLGGALSQGSIWPSQYNAQSLPTYLASYYGLNTNQYDYRYADGTVYGLDPKTQAISQVVALLTGQSPTVGQTMPAGYDVYNVPYAYRGQYADTAASQYRYNDGYVYQVDPKTRLVQAAIQLLT